MAGWIRIRGHNETDGLVCHKAGGEVKDCGIVVPTLGQRPEFIGQCLASIRDAGDCFVVVVRPASASGIDSALEEFVDLVVDDPEMGLARAINEGMSRMPPSVTFVNWIGDDDRLTPKSLATTRQALLESPTASFVYGACRYIDSENNQLWMNHSGRFASPLMLCGPQLIPQPGALFRKADFDLVGGLDTSLKWAFDLDLFLKLRKRDRPVFLRRVLSEFRWHEGSLSVGSRRGSVREASDVRRRHLPPGLRGASILWEPFVRRAILLAGTKVTTQMQKARAV